MKERRLSYKIVNVFIGASWAIMILFALFAFKLTQQHSIFIIISSTIFGLFVGMILILFFENILTNFENMDEQKKQTQLLEDIKNMLDEKISNN